MEKLTTWIKAERGRLTKLATALEVTPAAIKQWDEVPANRLIAIESHTGIDREELRPDLFDRTRVEAAQ